ncbi:toll/interleukin-1 receptor domain-containing protein [Brasilonema sp. CT11]|nr:toll/interleukin-1 receptor domain-containing protein [Brasilonema sp. CT11]
MSSTKAIKVFYCCSDSDKDEKLRNELEKHLSPLKRQKGITTWDKRMISAGKEWQIEIDTHLNTANIILLLISSDLIYSNYHWEVLVKRAMELHKTRQARVILVLLSTVDNWKSEFGNLKVLPEGEKPVTKWRNYDHAFENIAKGIREEVEQLTSSPFPVQNSLQQIEVGVRLTARTFWNLTSATVNLATATFSSLPRGARYRRRKKAKLSFLTMPIIIVVIAGVFLSQRFNLSENSSSESNQILSTQQNFEPSGWIWIGLINKTSTGLIIGDPLLQTSDPQTLPSIDPPSVPSQNRVVTIKRKVNLRENKTSSSQLLDELQPGEKFRIGEVKLLGNNTNSPYRQVWAQIGRCNQTCN